MIDHEQFAWARGSESVCPLSVSIQLVSNDAVVDVCVTRLAGPAPRA